MKKLMVLFLVLLTAFTFIMVGCGGDSGSETPPETKEEYTVRFFTNGGTTINNIKVQEGGKVTREQARTTRQYYSVENWYEDDKFTKLWDFDTSTVTKNTSLYAKWKHDPDPEPDPDNVVRAEKVTLVNAWYVVYQIVIPPGKSWSDYKELTASYMLGQMYIDEGVGRGMRLMGPYKGEDFTLCTTSGARDPADDGIRVAAADYNNEKNAAYILDNSYGTSPWGGSDVGSLKSCLNSAVGADPVAEEWFPVKYIIDGTKKHNDYKADNLPPTQNTLYFGLGLPGQGPATAQTSQENIFYVRDVTLVGYEEADNIIGKPVSFRYQGNEYPAYTGYPHVDATFGTKEVKREICDPNTLQKVVVDVTWDPIIKGDVDHD
ncbi:InlB B-repeat-containing protein [Treponema sp. R80B11-R83G3]